jgi:hypothetical protein
LNEDEIPRNRIRNKSSTKIEKSNGTRRNKKLRKSTNGEKKYKTTTTECSRTTPIQTQHLDNSNPIQKPQDATPQPLNHKENINLTYIDATRL